MQDWKCPRSRYWGYEWGGRGIVKRGTSLELFIGITVHDALAALASLVNRGFEPNIDEIAETAYKQMYASLVEPQGNVVLAEQIEFAKEQSTLVEGLVRGFHKHVWPKLLAEYKIVAVESEMEYKLDQEGQFIFMTKPDLIVENKEGELIYLEYKTTSSKKDTWVQSWETAVQLHSSIMAAEQTLGRRPAYVQIVGLYKGYESYGKQGSPFCYAYKKFGNPPFTQDQVQYDYKAGFKRYPTWELEGGVKAWIESMPDNVLADQFPMTAPIFVNEDLVNAFFRQRLAREKQIAEAYESNELLREVTEDPNFIWGEDLDKVFPQKFDQCVPSFGWSCPYKKLCHGQVANPLDEGYELRQPHHARELEAYESA